MHVERPLRQSSFLPPFSARLPLRQQFLGRALESGPTSVGSTALRRSPVDVPAVGAAAAALGPPPPCRDEVGAGASQRRAWARVPFGGCGPTTRGHVRGPRAATWRGQGQGATVKSPDAWIERVFPQSCFRLFLIKEETWFRAEPPFRALAVFQIFFSEPPELLDHSL